jgi:N-acetylmuramoyl-L-alanine amidase
MKLFCFQCLIIFTVATLAGCVSRGPAPSPWAHIDDPRYPLPTLDQPNLNALAGHIICIDPGHGGPWSGTVAPSNGLREADVNLAVSMRLAEILEAGGATVILTRTGPEALVVESLSADLTARAAIAKSAKAEIFVSIHHNADIAKRSTKNDLEVYYARRDDGPSLDLAQYLTYALARRLRTDGAPKRLLPGNYKVLREASMPAVLLESSYLSNRRNAKALAKKKGINAEAEAIAAGLADYFAANPPQISDVSHSLLPGGGLSLTVLGTENQPMDSDSTRIWLSQKELQGNVQRTNLTTTWTLGDVLPNGQHPLRIRIRNIAGLAAEHRSVITIARPPAEIHLRQSPPITQGEPESRILIEAHIRDGLGLAVADGTVVRLAPGDHRSTTTDGLARFYISGANLESVYHIHTGDLSEEFIPSRGQSPWRTVQVTDKRTGDPVGQCILTNADQTLAMTNSDGWAHYTQPTSAIRTKRNGYSDQVATSYKSHTHIHLDPLHEGRLFNRTIVLDPMGGGRDAGAVGPSGQRASDGSLQIALETAAALRKAGAQAIILREGDKERSLLERVTLSESHNPDLYIAITLGARPSQLRLLDEAGHNIETPFAFAAHYPTSKNGARLTEAIAQELGFNTVLSTVYYPVQQVKSPAVVVQPAHIGHSGAEQVLRSQESRRAIGVGLFRAIRAYFEEPAS